MADKFQKEFIYYYGLYKKAIRIKKELYLCF